MIMSKYNDIGAVSIPGITPEIGVTDLNPGKMLLVTSLNAEGPDEPTLVPYKHTGSLKKVFAYAKPSIEVDLDTGDEDDPTEEIKVNFEKLTDFKPDEITKQIPLLKRLSLQGDTMDKLLSEIMKNIKLQRVLGDTDQRLALIEALQSIINELTPPEA